MKSKVAIIGRPNVGKSSLYNYILGKRIAIVENTPGVTRDRLIGEASWRDAKFDLIDTAGVVGEKTGEMEREIQEQTDMAISTADVIVFLTSIKDGVTKDDEEIAKRLKKASKKVILVVNKADSYDKEHLELYEFYSLGLGEPLRLSVANGIGIGDLLDKIYFSLPKKGQEEENEKLKIALIGKPNVGKSSIINAVIGEKRNVVSNIAGTTRDAIDVPFSNEYGDFIFIDTAGLRRKSKINENIELYSGDRTKFAIERSDVAILVLDATEELSNQDVRILGYAHEEGKGIIILVNKWDLYEKDQNSMKEFKEKILKECAYASYAKIIFVSAKTGKRIDNICKEVVEVYKNNSFEIKSSELNKIIGESVNMHQPPSDKGIKLKIYYGTQIKTNPPTFLLFVNRKELFHYSYQRYILNNIRKYYPLEGTRLKLVIRDKKEDRL